MGEQGKLGEQGELGEMGEMRKISNDITVNRLPALPKLFNLQLRENYQHTATHHQC